MREKTRELLRIDSYGRISLGETFEEAQERFWIVIIQQPVRRPFTLRGIKRTFRNQRGAAYVSVALIESELMKVADRPMRELAEARELARVVRQPPAGAVGRFVRRL